MNQLTQEQLEKINFIEQQVQDLIKNTSLDELKNDYHYFLELLEYARKGEFFFFRIADQNKKLEDGESSAKSFFRGNSTYSMTTFHELKKSNNIKNITNRANVYFINFLMKNPEDFRFQINISKNQELIKLVNSQILPELRKKISLNEFNNTSNRLFLESESFNNIHSLISQIKPILDEIFKDKDYIKTWDFKAFVKAFEKRIDFINKEMGQSSSLHTQFKKIFKDENQANTYFDTLHSLIQKLNIEIDGTNVLTTKPKDNNSVSFNIKNWYIFRANAKKLGITLHSQREEVSNLEPATQSKDGFSEKINDKIFKFYYLDYKNLDKYIKAIEEDVLEIYNSFKDKSSTHKDAHNSNITQMIFNKEIRKNFLFNGINSNTHSNQEKMNNNNNISIKQQSAKNIILYGPPGTGKTYSLKKKVCQLAFSEIKEGHDRNVINYLFEQLRKEGRVEFITFHPSYSYEEFVEGISVDTSSEEMKYILRDGVFKKIAQKAEKNYLLSKQSSDLYNFEELFSDFSKELENKESIEVETARSRFKITEITEKSIFFDKEKGDSKHSLSIQTLKKIFQENNCKKYVNGGLEGYYQGLLNEFNKIKHNYKLQKDSLKPYFLLIDEINRGDMAKIFGELITLLEEDKRLGEDEELIIDKLPNSQERFGVPPNLYIIGTMNTADRSISLIDIALRRRFEFEEMMPKLDDNSLFVHLNHIPEFDNFRKFIIEINDNICKDEDIGRDKQIGHAFLLKIKQETYKEDIIRVWNKKIMPLLEEYTYGEISKLENILKIENKFEIDGLSMKKENRFILN